jgi:BlaI family transcriptional regulator, penicillinase repressor
MKTPKQTHSKPTDAEMKVLNILWERGSLTVRQVHEHLTVEKSLQYTTILKVMQVMTSKGLLQRDDSERSHVYKPTVGREQVQTQFARHLLQLAFGGSMGSLLMGTLEAQPASKKELAELRRILDEHEKGRKR